MVDFLKGITKQAETFAAGVDKLTDLYEKDIKSEEYTQDTTAICLNGLPTRVRTINEIFASHVKIAQLQAIETLELFTRNYSVRSSSFIQEANKYRADLKVLEKNIEKSQNKYYKMCKKREKYETEIEKAIQEHEKGQLTFAQVQKKSNQAFDVKKNAELAYHDYVQDLEKYNNMIENAQGLYKDALNRLQDLDEERVKTIQETVEQFFKTFNDSGSILSDKFAESITSTQLLNPHTDIRIFIDENRSKKPFLK